MKKAKKNLLLMLGLFLLPSVIYADSTVKPFTKANYVLDDALTVNCPVELEQEGTIYGEIFDDKVLFFELLGNKMYLVDYDGTYREVTLKEYNESVNAYEYDYELENNKIYKALYSISAYIPSTDTSFIDDKKYMQIEGYAGAGYLGSQIKENPLLDQNPTSYYNEIRLTRTKDKQINENTTYYMRNYEENFSVYEVVSNKNAEDLWQYYVLLPEKEYLFDFSFDEEHTAPGINQEDLILESVFTFNGEDYLIFHAPQKYFIYNQDGKYIDLFGHDNITRIINTNDFIGISYMEDEKGYTEIYDMDGNLILAKEELINESLLGITQPNNNTLYVSSGDFETIVHVTKITTYKLLEANASNYEGDNLTVKFTGELSKLTGVKVNDEELDEDNYTKESGSTIITLKKDYLNTLAQGTHTLKVEYIDGGYASFNFTIPVTNPQTVDGIMYSIIIGCISLIGLIGAGLYTNKKKLN